MGVATARTTRAPNPLAAKLLKVGPAPPSAPRNPDPTPTFLPRPSAFWRALRDEWVSKRGGAPGLVATTTTIPKTTIADVVEIANHVTLALRNDVGRVDEVAAVGVWSFWRDCVKLLRKLVARATDDTALYPRNESLWARELRQIAIFLTDFTRNAAPADFSAPSSRPAWDITLDPSAATFLPDPLQAHAALLAPFRRVRGPSHDRDFPALLVGDVAPIAAFVTAALRRDLPTLSPLDAKVIEQRWRQAVAVMRGVLAIEKPDRPYPELALLDSDLSLLLRGLRRARSHPGSLGREVSFPAASPRNTASIDDALGQDDDNALPAATLAITRVEIEIIDPARPTVAAHTFASLSEADEALARRFARTPPIPDGGDAVAFVVTWSDGRTSTGHFDVSPALVAAAPGRGGLLRSHLFDLGRWVLSDAHAQAWHRYFGTGKPAELAERRAWGHDLLDRLATDSAGPGSLAARRNRQQGMPYVGGGVPDFRPTKRAAAMFAGLSLLPNSSATVEALWQRYRDANGPDASSHEDPPAPLLAVRDLIAIANFMSAELRRDLRSLFAQDAAVIWKKWRDVALDLRVEVRGRDPHEWSTYRAFPLRIERLARDLETARSAPGKLFEAFCPWREAYFTSSEIRPDQRSGNWRKSRLEVNAWVPS